MKARPQKNRKQFNNNLKPKHMSTHAEIKQLLKDDDAYYRGIGRQYLSNSDIGILLSNPQAYGLPSEDKKHFVEGKLFHRLLIEPDKVEEIVFVDVSTRNTKEYKKFVEENGLEFALLKKEVDDIYRLARIVKSNISFYDEIYNPGNKYEEAEVGVIKDTQWKGKADIVCKDFIIDLKTTSDINKFRYSSRAYNYDSQAYIYQMLFGKPLVFYVVDKETGQLGRFTPTQNFIESGERKVERAIEVWRKYFSPSKTDDIENYFIDDYLD
ncbi:MAG: putative exonuclease [Podoviridae sp. ctrTa16]|nr:MAG: putative exonuclease [Podoviridae sp. ctrTa16]